MAATKMPRSAILYPHDMILTPRGLLPVGAPMKKVITEISNIGPAIKKQMIHIINSF